MRINFVKSTCGVLITISVVLFCGVVNAEPNMEEKVNASNQSTKQIGFKPGDIKFEVGDVKLKFWGFSNLYYTYYENDNDAFEVKNTRLMNKLDLGKNMSAMLQLDFGSLYGDNDLLEYWVQYKDPEHLGNFLKISFGQFSKPFGLHFGKNLNNLMMADGLSLVVDELEAKGSLRDKGIRFNGEFTDLESEFANKFNYDFAIVNGEPRKESETNKNKAFVGRVGYHLFGKRIAGFFYNGLEFGLSYYNGDRGVSKYKRKRWGTDFRYKDEHLRISGEYITSNDDQATWAQAQQTKPGTGYFIESAYRFDNNIEPGFRYDVWEPDNGEKSTVCGVGVNWYFIVWSRLQIFYEFIDEETNDIDNNMLIFKWRLDF